VVEVVIGGVTHTVRTKGPRRERQGPDLKEAANWPHSAQPGQFPGGNGGRTRAETNRPRRVESRLCGALRRRSMEDPQMGSRSTFRKKQRRRQQRKQRRTKWIKIPREPRVLTDDGIVALQPEQVEQLFGFRWKNAIVCPTTGKVKRDCGRTADLYIARAGAGGLGVFARSPIPAGVRVCGYAGERIAHAELKKRIVQAIERHGRPYYPYALEISSSVRIDAERVRNYAALINHAGQARNCEFGRGCVVTVRRVPAHHQLLVDYGPRYWRSQRPFDLSEVEPQPVSLAALDARWAKCSGTADSMRATG